MRICIPLLLPGLVAANGGQVRRGLRQSQSLRALARKRGARHTPDDIAEFLQGESERSFPGLPLDPRDRRDRLRGVLKAGEAAGCDADILARAMTRLPPDPGPGLGARINNFANEVLLAMYGNYSLAVCSTSNGHTFPRDVWSNDAEDPVFNNPMPFPTCDSEEACKTANIDYKQADLRQRGGFSVEDWKQPWDSSMTFAGFGGMLAALADRRAVDDLKHFIYPYLFTPSNRTRDQVEDSLSALGVHRGERYIGVHIRRGDKVQEEDNVPTSTYSDAVHEHAASMALTERVATVGRAIRDLLETHHLGTVYVASDDPTARDELQEQLGSGVKVLEQPRDEPEETYAEREYEAMQRSSFRQILVDIEALRRAEVFVGTVSSNFGRLVYFLRDQNSTSVGVDAQSDWLSRPT